MHQSNGKPLQIFILKFKVNESLKYIIITIILIQIILLHILK